MAKEERMLEIINHLEKVLAHFDQKTEEIRVLTKAAEKGRLIDFSRLNPDEYEKTITNLYRRQGRKDVNNEE